VLRVRDADASARVHSYILGLEATTSILGRMVFMRASGDSSHELVLMSVGKSVPGPEPDRVGLYHFVWEMEFLDDLRRIYRELQQKGVNIAGIGDHGRLLGVYLFDPEGNEIKVFYELPRDQWSDRQAFDGRFPGSLED
jgi:catechol-2,3-dioxygenase